MMPIIKKNILSILCGVVVLIAVIAYFAFVRGMFYGDDGLQKAADERKAQYDQLAGLLGKQRTLPVVSLTSTEPIPLPAYPTLPVIQAGEQVTKDLQAQAKRMLALAAEKNRKQPLVPGVFPKPDDIRKASFRDAYDVWVNTTIPQVLTAANPPTEEDVAAREEKLWEEKYAKKIYYVDNVEQNRQTVDQEYLAEIEGLREKMDREIAEQYMVYLDPGAFTTNMDVYRVERSPDTRQVWYTQTAVWVQEEIARSIAALNANAKAKNITQAPVKHIVRADVPPGPEQYIRPAQAAAAAEESAAAATPAGPDYTFTPTGRVCNEKYDVVKFTLVVKMDAQFVPALVQELSREKFITTHKVDLTSVDAQLAREDGFFYGANPVVQATITGEALLLREWTLKLMPDVIKKEMPGAAPAEAVPAETVASR